MFSFANVLLRQLNVIRLHHYDWSFKELYTPVPSFQLISQLSTNYLDLSLVTEFVIRY